MEIKSANIVDKPHHDGRLSPLVQNYVPNKLSGMTPITVQSEKSKVPKLTPVHTVVNIMMQNMRGNIFNRKKQNITNSKRSKKK